MRTTINIAEDALLAARHVAQRERISLGEAVSELVRRGTRNDDMAALREAVQAMLTQGKISKNEALKLMSYAETLHGD